VLGSSGLVSSIPLLVSKRPATPMLALLPIDVILVFVSAVLGNSSIIET